MLKFLKNNFVTKKLLGVYEKITFKKHREAMNVSKSFKNELYRKLIHLSSLWIPALIYIAHPGVSILLFALLFVADVVIEYGNYKKRPWARKTFGNMFFKTLRNKERVRTSFQVSGSMYVLASAIICTLLFSKIVAAIALSVMLVSDTCAALFGKAYGTRKIYKSKSLEGTVAFFLSALIINMLFEPFFTFTYLSVIACAIATFAEVYEDKLEIDDNFSIPLVMGTILTIATL